MRRVLVCSVLLLISVNLFSCGQQPDSQGGGEKSLKAQLFQMAHMNGCIDCHRVAATVIGPSWQAIADRYKDVPFDDAKALLIERVKKGSKGNWLTMKGADGMPPMEKRVSAEHIEQLVEFIVKLNRGEAAVAP